MYNNPYQMQPAYGQQNLNDRIDSQIAQLQQMKEQFKTSHQPSINQTFQLAPNNAGIKYANSYDEVNRETIYVDTPFFSNDLSIVWIKNVKGEIRSYELNEIIAKDNKDLMIENLQLQIKELRKEIKNANTNNEFINDAVENEKPTNVSNVRKSTTKQKQSNGTI